MKKWAISAVVYLLLVIGGYTVYAEFIKEEPENNQGMVHDEASEEHGNSTEEHDSEDGSSTEDYGVADHEEATEDHSHGTDAVEHSEVSTNVNYQDSTINISIKDSKGNPVTDLEVNHEKILHLIVVDDQLDQYYHLHPDQVGAGEFAVKKELKEGTYKAFVDIKPKDLEYHVSPNAITVGTEGHGHGEGPKPDQTLTKKVDGEEVTLQISSTKSNEPVSLDFDLDKTNLETYLGAAGHVVILDEKADHYLHVHPASNEEPTFETQFNEAGIYKIWAEFKQNGKVRVFPFVVEIK